MFDYIIGIIFNLVNMLISYLWWDASSLIAHSKLEEKKNVKYQFFRLFEGTNLYIFFNFNSNQKILDN